MTLRARLLALLAPALGIALALWDGQGPRVAPDPKVVRVEISSDGTLRVRARFGGVRALGRLSRADPTASAAALRALREEFVRRRADPLVPEAVEPDGSWAATLEIAAEGPAPWYAAQWVVLTATDPWLKAVHLRWFGPRAEETVATDLPRDGSDFGRRSGRVRFVRVTLTRAAAGRGSETEVRASLGSQAALVPEPGTEDEVVEEEGRVEGLAGLREWLARRSGLVRGRPGWVDTPLPRGAEVPCGDVVAAMLELLRAQASEIAFVGAWVPLPRGR